MTGFVGAMEAVVWDRICGTMEAVVLVHAFVRTIEAVV